MDSKNRKNGNAIFRRQLVRRLARLGLALALLGVAWAGGPAPARAQLEGSYDTIGPLPKPHSLKVVQFDEYLNFTCPHCNNFRTAAKPLKKKFGKRLQVTYIPVLFRNQSDGALRLFFIAEAAGRAEEVKNLIFDATFSSGVNINDPSVVSYLARSSGLGEQFRKDVNSEWVTQKVIDAQQRASEAGIHATPTIVLEQALRITPSSGMQSFVGNLERLIEQMLSKP